MKRFFLDFENNAARGAMFKFGHENRLFDIPICVSFS